MNILVTGAAGFIGSHLVEKLIKDENFVVGVDNFHNFYSEDIKIKNILEITNQTDILNEILSKRGRDEKIKDLIFKMNSDKFVLEYCDLKDIERLETIFEKYNFDMVVNLAGLAGVRPSLENSIEYVKVNIGGYLNLLECSKKYNVKKFIQASSSSVYGNNKVVPFKETDIVDNAISPYAATKKSCEVLGYTYFSLYNIDFLQFRFFTVFGPRQRPDLAIHKFVNKILLGKPIPFFGEGDSFRDYTYIDDIIDGIIKGISYLKKTNRVYEIFNLGESHTISLKQMVEMIEKLLNKKAIINKLPEQLGDVRRTFADISKAKEILNYNPTTDFETGMKKFVEWYLGGR